MKWVLVWILITGPQSMKAFEVDRFHGMMDCFAARQEILVDLKQYDGMPKVNTQYICVRTDYE